MKEASEVDDQRLAGLPAQLHRSGVDSIASTVRKGVAGTVATRAMTQVIQIAATAVLARLLTPGDYGLAALVTAITGFAAILVDLGIASSVIQRRSLDGTYLSTAFWLNLALAVGLASTVAATAVPVAKYFNEPRLVGLVMTASLTLALSVNAVHIAVLRRTLDYAAVNRITATSFTAGVTASLISAVGGLGPYSLIVGPIVERLAANVHSLVVVRWWPDLPPTRAAARDIWVFGRGLTGYFSMMYLVSSLDRFIVGRVASIVDLGHYNRGANVMMLPVQQSTQILASVLYPALAAISGDSRRLQSAWGTLVRAAWFLGLPAAVGIAAAAPALVSTLYGPQWEAVVPIVRILALAIPFMLLGSTTAPLFEALGQTGLQFRLGLWSLAPAVIALAVGSQWGVQGIAFALVARSVAALCIQFPVALRLVGPGAIRTVVIPLWRTTVGTLVMALTLWLTTIALAHLPSPLVLTVTVALGIAVYGGMSGLLERPLVRRLIGLRSGR